MKYKKKDEFVDAVQYCISDTLPDWFMDLVTKNDIILHKDGSCGVRDTLTGEYHEANYGDYIVLSDKGGVSIVKQNIFKAIFEEVD